MYIRRNIKFKLLFNDSWKFIIVASLWSSLVVYLHEFVGLGLISAPIQPITTIGVAVSIYLGFKGKETYDRWWEARKLWGEIIGASRSFASLTHSFLYKNSDADVPKDIKTKLLHNHLAWVLALKYQLRLTSRFKEKRFGIFDQKVVPSEDSSEYMGYLDAETRSGISKTSNPAVQILIEQSRYIKELSQKGFLDSIRQSQMIGLVNECLKIQGKCERIKRTPFPRAFAYFGEIFTWIFIILLPLGFIEVFEAQGIVYKYSDTPRRAYMFAMVPFTVIISWIFYTMERVSDSMEDPFEGGINDIPMSAMSRTIEIDLLESLGEGEIPKPIAPRDYILY